MSLYGALYSGVSGLQSQSSAMGAIADNITNINTTGYKGTRVNFQTLVTKQVSLTQYSAGGVQSKPRGSIDIQGLLQATTASTDMAISGGGFFVVNEAGVPGPGDLYAYTRAGSFRVDREGNLVNTGGFYLQGWPLQTWDGTATAATVNVGNDIFMKAYSNDAGGITYINDSVIDRNNLRPLNLTTIGGTATATTTLSIGANLPANAAVDNTEKTNALIYDSLGNSHNLNYTWAKAGQNAWNVNVEPPRGAASIELRDQAGNIYYSAGRLDFRDTGMPASGSTIDFDGTTVNFSNTLDPDGGGAITAAGDDWTMIARGGFDFTGLPADGETFTINNAGTPIVFEFDNNGVVTAGRTSIAIAGTAAGNASNLAAAVQAALGDRLGPGTWATATGAHVDIGGPAAVAFVETLSNFAAGAATAAAVNINPTGKTLSQVVDLMGRVANVILVGSQGVPPTVPGQWAGRVAGTNGVAFAADETNDITFDTSTLLDATGAISVEQSDTAAGDAFTVTRVSGTSGWTVANRSAVSFNGNGTPDTFFGRDETQSPDPRASVHINWTNGALDMNGSTIATGGSPAVSLFLGNYNVGDGLTQLGGPYELNYISQNGATFGSFAGLSVGQDGIVTALFDNGVNRPVFMIPVATFVNPNALESLTGNSWIETSTSGQATVREAGSAGAGGINGAALEASTVDLGEEFTTMITTQRAYSAAAKIITTSDEMLDELVRIKR